MIKLEGAYFDAYLQLSWTEPLCEGVTGEGCLGSKDSTSVTPLASFEQQDNSSVVISKRERS